MLSKFFRLAPAKLSLTHGTSDMEMITEMIVENPLGLWSSYHGTEKKKKKKVNSAICLTSKNSLGTF